MGDRHANWAVHALSPNACAIFCAESDEAANEPLFFVSEEGAGKDPCLAENLKTVASANDWIPLFGEATDFTHDWRTSCDGAAAQIVAVGEPAGKENRIETGERMLFVPNVVSIHAKVIAKRIVGVLVAICTGKADNRNLQETTSNR
jgi:hypothetical protein